MRCSRNPEPTDDDVDDDDDENDDDDDDADDAAVETEASWSPIGTVAHPLLLRDAMLCIYRAPTHRGKMERSRGPAYRIPRGS